MSGALFELPPGLRNQFNALARRLWWVETFWALAMAGTGVVGSLLVFFVADRLFGVSAGARWLFFFITLTALVATGWWWAQRWWMRKPTWEDLSKVVQRRHRRLGDRLLGIVELAHQKENGDVSPALCRAAIAQVAEETAGLSFVDAVDVRLAKRWGGVLALLVVLAAASAVTLPEAWKNSLVRWAWPGSAVERFTFIEVLGLADRWVVPYGEPYELQAEVRYRSPWRPQKVEARLPGHELVTGTIEGSLLQLNLPPLTETTVVRLSHGDWRQEVVLVPTHRPALTGLTATVEWPSYLKREIEEVPLDQGTLRLIEGGRAGLRATMTRDLVWARMEPEMGVGPELREAEWSVPLTDAWMDGDALAVQWKDVLGLTGRQPLQLQIKRYPDAAPRPDLKDLPTAVAILPDEVLEFQAVAEDDFGLERLEVRYSLFDRSAGNEPMGTEEVWEAQEGGANIRQMQRGLRFSPQVLGIQPGTSVLVRARAKDFKPGREWVNSPPYQILVLTPAEHATLLQEKLEKVAEGVEAVVQGQENLLARTEETARLDGGELASSETAEELAAQAREQERLREQAEALAREAAKALEEAMRNEGMTAEQLTAMAELANRLQEAARNGMSQAQANLSQASRQQQERRSVTEEARAQEAAALEQLRQIQQDLAQESDRAQAKNFAARLRDISGVQREVEQELKKSFPAIVGMLPDQVPVLERARLENLAGKETASSAESSRLQNEMKAFALRMKAEAYEAVVGEMVETEATRGLEQLGQLVAANRSATAIGQAAHWAKSFEGWAERLSEAAKQMGRSGGGGGGGGGGGSMSPEMMEMMMELARLRQRQASAQQETRAADESLKDSMARHQRSQSLAQRQTEMRQKMEELGAKLPPQLSSMGAAIRDAMSDAAEGLKQGDLGEETTGAQATAVELLTQLLMNPSMGGGGAGAMMMAMMGASSGPGSSAGGNASQRESDVQGENAGGKAGQIPTEFRSGERTSGGSSTEWPPEYREALEGFFQGAAREAP
ncbi:MAG: hypothetical protein OHK005_11660 [Candidatus Methylacidiphilales bacterium]